MKPDPQAEFDSASSAPRVEVPEAAARAAPQITPAMARALLAMVAAAAAVGGLLVQLVWRQPGDASLAFALLAMATLACTRLPAARLATALVGVLLALMAGLGHAAMHFGWGIASPGLSLFGLLVCLGCAAVGPRAGIVLALVGAAISGAVAWWATPSAEIQALEPQLPHMAARVLLQGFHIAAGLAAGLMIARVLARHTQAVQEREERFVQLLALAADVYWELDAQYRLVGAAAHSAALRRPPPPLRPPWETPGVALGAETLDLLQASLDAREPFRDLRLVWTPPDRAARTFLASGKPRFNARGIFLGYWGVARDVTEIEGARDALRATEARYQELFSRIPTPLVLHRDGRVIDANPAAQAMFGGAEGAELGGSELLASYEEGESRERERRRLTSLDRQPLGTALPVADFKLRLPQRLASVRATAVRVEAAGGPAVLSIFVDDTVRLLAEEAVRRSEGMLAHLVATSPDIITLTELASGRYAMVNQAFERVSGWGAAEAVGRTALELGVWGDAAARERFVELLRERGAVADLPVAFRTKAGATLPMLVSAARFVMDRRDYLVINARDMTERERERLQREAILDNASIGIAVTRERCFVLVNRHFEQLYGWAPGELIGQPGAVVWVDAADYAAVGAKAGPPLARGEAIEFERTVRRRDGSTFEARVRGHAIDPAQPRSSGTVWIVEDVSERHAVQLALARARDEAEAANRAKSAFLANTSHELRTPLNGIIGLARLARTADVDDARRADYLDHILDSAQALAAIISDILDLSKIEAGKMQIESARFDLGEQLRALQQVYTPLAQAGGLALKLELAPQVEGHVHGDALRLRQVVSNYLNNAIKFTPQGGVTLRARRGLGSLDHRVRIEVEDSGPGFDEATRARLFMPFTQADQSITRRHGGTGLGLSICRELARLMGGEVGAEGQPGQGARFWVELPLPRAAAVEPEAPRSTVSPAMLAGARVLMVEDNPVNMMIGVAQLERWGVVVEQAADGREAVAAVQRAHAAGHPYDIVLMDVQMPVMSGYEATLALRAAGHTLPIIALTAAAMVGEREQALAAGMNDFLTKPVDAGRLQEALARWLEAE
ncbi:Histidine kinase [Rubrivivax sp. A210]|uniref:PAS domain S-box protein n=1 Tax=Rubrivivax sp. A210 TaxID=2772301 RepID=UPI001917BB98|nr:PAS domain S-box protein [Rubrivivax sp. A210]CAD5373234.1 Histidine kinase [Rubrivivax sp. A210]